MKRLRRIFRLVRLATTTVNSNSEIVRPGFVLLAALAVAGPVHPQSLDDLDKCEQLRSRLGRRRLSPCVMPFL
jgi:hypothetical protein